jgi:hypothetical protein|tara:strand:- start:313 stop:849 length:537 start_codon:yes stop_codon:yes gene_type:complete
MRQNFPAAEFARIRSILACRSSKVTCPSCVFAGAAGALTEEARLSEETLEPPPAAFAAMRFMRSRSVVSPALADETRAVSGLFVMLANRWWGCAVAAVVGAATPSLSLRSLSFFDAAICASRSRYTSAAVRSIDGMGEGAMGGAGAAIAAAARRGVAAAIALALALRAVSTFASPRLM